MTGEHMRPIPWIARAQQVQAFHVGDRPKRTLGGVHARSNFAAQHRRAQVAVHRRAFCCNQVGNIAPG